MQTVLCPSRFSIPYVSRRLQPGPGHTQCRLFRTDRAAYPLGTGVGCCQGLLKTVAEALEAVTLAKTSRTDLPLL